MLASLSAILAPSPAKNANRMSLEHTLVHIVQTFTRYSSADGKSGELDQSELKKLVKAEFPALCDMAKDDELLTSVMKVMDLDGDKVVTFKEYACFLACLSMELESFIDMDACYLNPGITLEQVVVQMVKIFKKYSGADSKSGELDQNELDKLLKEEFPTLSEEGKDEMLDSLMKMMDLDGDRKVSYKEFAEFLACLSMELEAYL